MYKMTTDAMQKDARPPHRQQQTALPSEASTEQLHVPNAGTMAKPARRVYRPAQGQLEEAEAETPTVPTIGSASIDSKAKAASRPYSAGVPVPSHPSVENEEDGLQPPPGAYRVGLQDESRISQVGLLPPAPVAPESMRMLHESAASRPEAGGSIAHHSEVSSLTTRSYATPAPIQGELVHASAVTTAEVTTGDGTEAGNTGVSTGADESISRDVEDLKKQVNHNSFQNRVLLIVLIVIVFIAIAVGITVAFLLTGGSDGTPAPSPITPQLPVVETPAPTPSDPLSREDVQNEIEEQSPTTSFDTDSPARRALDWLTGDAFSMGLMSNGDLTKLLQRFGLAVLYFATNGSNWKSNEGWLQAKDECIEWRGVICDNGRLTQIEQQSNRLQGSIPVESILFIKDSVLVFNLARNDLVDGIPTEIGEMRQLTDLRLFENELVGTIPAEVADLTLLRHLAFTLNDLSGTFPPIPEMRQLTFLDLRDNPRLRGPLPDDFRGLDSLEEVYLFGTELSGTLSSELCDTLGNAWIDCGDIECACCTANEGERCPEATAMPTPLGATPFPTKSPTPPPAPFPTPPPTGGPTPPPVATNPPTPPPTTPFGTNPPTADPTVGTPPPSPSPTTEPPSYRPTRNPTPAPTAPARSFREVILQFSPGSSIDNSGSPAGKAFDWLGGDQYSRSQLVANNDVSVVQRFALATLFYAMNGASGWNNRGWLDDESECVGWNVGDLQCSGGKISLVDLYDINDGVVAGSIPDEVGLLTALTKFDVARNDVGGRIPTQFGRLVKLTDLRLFENELVGALPNQLSSLVELRHFAVTLNQLDGSIPRIFDGMSKLTFLDLRDNKFGGDLPGGMEGMDSLAFLYLFNLDVGGTLPSELCDTLQDAWIDCGEVACDCCTARFGDDPC